MGFIVSVNDSWVASSVNLIAKQSKFYSAFFMAFFFQIISYFLQTTSISELQDIMIDYRMFGNGFQYNIEEDKLTKLSKLNHERIFKICKLLKSWQCDIKSFGLHTLDSLNGDGLSSDDFNECYGLILYGKYCMKSSSNGLAIDALVKSLKISTSLHARTSSLRYLSEICESMDYLIIALKLLNVAYKYCFLCEWTIRPLFVNELYGKKRKALKIKMKKMACNHCGSKKRLKCCVGCMNVVYCSKYCQKRDWSSGHRMKCDKSWLEHSEILKSVMI